MLTRCLTYSELVQRGVTRVQAVLNSLLKLVKPSGSALLMMSPCPTAALCTRHNEALMHCCVSGMGMRCAGIKGRGEYVRLLFEDAGVPYVDAGVKQGGSA